MVTILSASSLKQKPESSHTVSAVENETKEEGEAVEVHVALPKGKEPQ